MDKKKVVRLKKNYREKEGKKERERTTPPIPRPPMKKYQDETHPKRNKETKKE